MAVPDFQSFMLPLLSQLADGQEHKLQDLYVLLAADANLTDDDKNELLPSGKQRVFHNRIGWARTYLKKAGLLNALRLGVFTITEDGIKLLNSKPDQITKSTLAQFPIFHEWQNGKGDSSTKSNQGIVTNASIDAATSMSPTDQMETSFGIIQSELSDEILTLVRECSPRFFETLVIDLMLAMGYGGWSKESGKATQYSADGGIDGVINEDPLGLEIIYLQAKRYQQKNTPSVGLIFRGLPVP
jgi:restriction system protein